MGQVKIKIIKITMLSRATKLIFNKNLIRTPVIRSLSLTQNLFSELDADFDQAKQTLNILKSEPGNDVKLQIYALFKQATKGENTESPPSAINFVSKLLFLMYIKILQTVTINVINIIFSLCKVNC